MISHTPCIEHIRYTMHRNRNHVMRTMCNLLTRGYTMWWIKNIMGKADGRYDLMKFYLPCKRNGSHTIFRNSDDQTGCLKMVTLTECGGWHGLGEMNRKNWLHVSLPSASDFILWQPICYWAQDPPGIPVLGVLTGLWTCRCACARSQPQVGGASVTQSQI